MTRPHGRSRAPQQHPASTPGLRSSTLGDLFNLGLYLGEHRRAKAEAPATGATEAVASTTAAQMSALILKRASVSRPSGQWRDDDYVVLKDGVVIGRIFFLDAVGPPLH